MSTRTNSWSNSAPVDHSQIKNLPAAIRRAFIDMEDRLDDILAGFETGENTNGIKLGRFLTIGTAHSSMPTGTGSAASIDLYVITTSAQYHLYAIDGGGRKTLISAYGANLLNNSYLKALDPGGTGPVNILKVNTASAIEFATHPRAPDTGPTVATQYAPKGYVDAVLSPIAMTDYFSTSTKTGWAATPTGNIEYYKIGKLVFVSFSITGTSNAAQASFTLPFTSAATNATFCSMANCTNAGVGIANEPVTGYISGGGATVETFINGNGGSWTATGTKTINGSLVYLSTT